MCLYFFTILHQLHQPYHVLKSREINHCLIFFYLTFLVAVALSFFICWAPFHVQRLIAIYGKNLENPSAVFFQVSNSDIIFFFAILLKCYRVIYQITT